MKKLTGVLVLTAAAAVAAGQETYTATAEVKNAAGVKKTAPVTISIDHFLTQAERDSVMAALKSSGQAAMKKILEGMKDAGSIEAGSEKTAIKYAFTRPTGGGKLVTVVAPQPIVHIGADLPDAKPKAGYDFTLVFLVLDSEGKGHGEFHPASKIKMREDGAIVTEGYGADTVWLKHIMKK
jgi:hypothetical protein